MTARLVFGMNHPFPGDDRAASASSRSVRRTLILGDFGGRGDQGAAARPLHQRPLLPVDLDTFEGLFQHLSPRVTLAGVGPDGQAVDIPLAGLDDLHPDALFDSLEHLQPLRQLRRRLTDPATADEALATLGHADAPPSPSPSEDDADTVKRLLGRDRGADVAGSDGPDLQNFLRRLIAPHIIPDADPRLDDAVTAVDSALAAQLREVLHHPDFRSLEAAWRGLHWLMSTTEFDADNQLFILDVTRRELLADAAQAGPDGKSGQLWQRLVDQECHTPGSTGWSLLVNLEAYGAGTDDVAIMQSLSRLAAGAEAPLIAGARPELLGCASIAQCAEPRTWQEPGEADAARWLDLRRSTAARWLGLTLPRMLLRLPYGPDTDPVDALPFCELMEPVEPENLLWGNSALAVANLLIRNQIEGLSTGPVLDDLPTYVHGPRNHRTLQPCAEILISETAAEAFLARGLTPIMSHGRRGAVSVPWLVSIADPPSGLPST